LVLGKHRHVVDVEAPATITDDSTHPEDDVVIREDPNRCSSFFDRIFCLVERPTRSCGES